MSVTSRICVTASMFVPLLLACGAPPESTRASEMGDVSLTDGVWVGLAGPDSFCFIFEEEEGVSGLTGRILSVRDGKAYMELPISTVELEGEVLSLEMNATGVSYKGTLDTEAGVIDGDLGYPGGGGMEMDLVLEDRDEVPGLDPMTGVPAGSYAYSTPDPSDDGWHCGDLSVTPETSAAAEALINGVLEGQAGLLHSVLVIHGGEIVLEEYFHGYGRDDLHGVASVTKSIGSLLVGLAVADGYISGVEAPLSAFFPGDADLFTGSKAEWTLRNLLTMSMGLDWPGDESETLHGTGPAFFREVLSRGLTGVPGENWLYVNAEADLLAGVIRSATGEQADAYAERRLFDPLGIEEYDWSSGNTEGYPQLDGTLMLRPRDMARIGWMVLDGGEWNGRQVLPAAWIEESTTRSMITGDPILSGYGYLWWSGRMQLPEADTPFILANGWGTQFILILPELDTVVVTTGGNQDNGMHMAVGGLLQGFLATLV